MPNKPGHWTPADKERWKRSGFKLRKEWDESWEMKYLEGINRKHILEGYIRAAMNGVHTYWSSEQVERLCAYATNRIKEVL
jgi:hypothetical protein